MLHAGFSRLKIFLQDSVRKGPASKRVDSPLVRPHKNRACMQTRNSCMVADPEQSPLLCVTPPAALRCCVQSRVPRIVPAASRFHFLTAWPGRLGLHKSPAPRLQGPKISPMCPSSMFSKLSLTLVRRPACLFPVFTAQSSRGQPVTGRRLQTDSCKDTFDESVVSRSGSC